MKKHVKGIIDMSFAKLTPRDNVDIKHYESAIDFAFNEYDINNIAFSGSYSSGKSSIMLTYEKNNPEKKIVHIALANFNTEDNKDDKDNGFKHTEKIDNIEGKIINQLIHSIDAKAIPKSNFKVKKDVTGGRLLFIVICIVLAVVCQSHLICYNFWYYYITQFQSPVCAALGSPKLMFLSGCIFLFLIGLFSYHLIRYQKNNQVLKKLKIAENEIEIFDKTYDSKFDKYLDEIKYLINKSNADALVFDDLDRFGCPLIFQRLREINISINNQERNLRNKLQSLRQNEDCKSFDAVNRISNYFKIKSLEKKIHCVKFFYLINDSVFTAKDRTKFFDFIIPVIPIVDTSNSYDMFRNAIRYCGFNNHFDDVFLHKLSLYVDDMRIINNICNEYSIYNARLNNTSLNPDKLLAVVLYKNLYPLDFCKLQFQEGTLYKILSGKQKMLDKIEQECNDRIARNPTLNEINRLIKEKQQVRCFSLQMCVIELGFDESVRVCLDGLQLNGNEFFCCDNQKQLIEFLVNEGYLDENYNDYISYFYENNSLGNNDKIFLRSVNSSSSDLHWGYELSNIKEVLYYLNDNDFGKPEVLNIYLLEYMLCNIELYKQNVISMIEVSKRMKFYDFIKIFLNNNITINDSEKKVLVPLINAVWQEFFTEIYNLNYEKFFMKLYALYTLVYCSKDQIEKVNAEKALSRFINVTEDLLEFRISNTENIEIIIESLCCLKIKLSHISSNVDERIVDGIYQNGLYEINAHNIMFFYKKYYYYDGEEFPTYSMLNNKGDDEPLLRYISDNTNEYITVLLNTLPCVKEKVKCALLLINNNDVSLDLKNKYIGKLMIFSDNMKQRVYISSLEKVPNKTLWKDLVSNDLIKSTENNIIQYFLQNGADTSLVKFINSSKSFDLTKAKSNQSQKEKFVKGILNMNAVFDSLYKQIIASSGIVMQTFKMKGIEYSKISILNKYKVIEMNRTNLTFMRENYSISIIEFIKNNLNEYLQIVDRWSTLVSVSEIVSLLETDLDSCDKCRLILLLDEPIDYEYVFQNFEMQDYTTQNAIIEAFKNTLVNKECDLTFRIPQNVLFRILSEDSEITARIFASQIPEMKNDDIIIAFTSSSFSEKEKFINLFDRKKHPRFTINERNRILLDALQYKQIFVSYSENNHQYTVKHN